MFSLRSLKIDAIDKRLDKFSRNKTNAEIAVTVSNRTLIRVFVMAVGFLVLLMAVKQASQALILIFTAFFLALALNAPVQWIAQHIPGKRRGSRSLATTISVVFVLLLLTGFLASIVPAFVRQVGGLVDSVPMFVNDLRNENSDIGKLVHRYNLESQVDSFSEDLSGRLKDASGAAVSVITQVGSSTFALLTIVVLTFMMLVEGPHWVKIGEQLIPKKNRAHSRQLARAMYKVVKGYVNGQVLLAGLAAFVLLPILVIMKVSYPIALVVVVFICGLIPMVGHTIGALLVSTVALFTSPISAIVVLGYYFLYQQIENYLIQPRIQSNSTNMSPLLVFIAVVVGVNFGGLLGGLVAIPIVGCIRIVVIDQLVRRNILDSKTAEATLTKAESNDSDDLNNPGGSDNSGDPDDPDGSIEATISKT